MKLQQLYTSCLAQGTYYLQSEGEAVVIDPLRDVEPYVQRAEQDGARIKYVIETHFHADFVSGHLDLAAATGATVVFGPEAKPGFAAHIAEDGEVLRFGKLSLEVLHTPGHTPESTVTCFGTKRVNRMRFSAEIPSLSAMWVVPIWPREPPPHPKRWPPPSTVPCGPKSCLCRTRFWFTQPTGLVRPAAKT